MTLSQSMQCSIPGSKRYNQIWPVFPSSGEIFFVSVCIAGVQCYCVSFGITSIYCIDLIVENGRIVIWISKKYHRSYFSQIFRVYCIYHHVSRNKFQIETSITFRFKPNSAQILCSNKSQLFFGRSYFFFSQGRSHKGLHRICIHLSHNKPYSSSSFDLIPCKFFNKLKSWRNGSPEEFCR